MAWGNYQDLKVWQQSMALVNDVYDLLKSFPSEEKYALSSQIRRSVVSIPSNIAEGQGRNSKKEFVQFLYIANGSLFELETQLTIATSQGYVTQEQAGTLFEKCRIIGKMIHNLALSQSN